MDLLGECSQVSDFVWYYERAVDVANGRGYAVDGIPTAYWPVGYPGFLSLIFRTFGPSVFIAKLANVLLYSGIVILSYQISRRIFHSETAARITVLLLSFSPNHIAFHFDTLY
jgi:4-amino-4-deoxy-L-arabinose transferase-like glycosyltransferase